LRNDIFAPAPEELHARRASCRSRHENAVAFTGRGYAIVNAKAHIAVFVNLHKDCVKGEAIANQSRDPVKALLSMGTAFPSRHQASVLKITGQEA
jgi:hypothetical protein